MENQKTDSTDGAAMVCDPPVVAQIMAPMDPSLITQMTDYLEQSANQAPLVEFHRVEAIQALKDLQNAIQRHSDRTPPGKD